MLTTLPILSMPYDPCSHWHPNFTFTYRGVNAHLAQYLDSVLNMKVVVAAFNQEKALVTSRGLLRDSEPSFQALVPAAAAPHQHQPRQCAESGGDQRENNRLQLDTNMAFAAARILKDKQQKEQQQENKRVM